MRRNFHLPLAMMLVAFLSAGVIACTKSAADLQGRHSPTVDSTPGLIASIVPTGYSYEDAEGILGVHIPRPSIDYPVAYSHADVYLQSQPGASLPRVETQYTFVPLAPTSIGLIVAPGEYWNGDGTWTEAEAITIGGKSGYRIRDDGGRSFAYECGRGPRDESVWCVASASAAIEDSDFDKFVGSLR